MTKSATSATASLYTYTRQTGEACTLRFEGRLALENAAKILKQVTAELKVQPPSVLTIDLSGVDYLDDYGAYAVIEIRNRIQMLDGVCHIVTHNARLDTVIEDLDQGYQKTARDLSTKRPKSNFLVHVGQNALQEAFHLRYTISFVGSVLLALMHVMVHPRALRWGDTMRHIRTTGAEAVPIVGLISFLLGLIMAFMSAMQLQQFGANIYVASLVALAMVSELGPIMTAIIVAGRSGSSYAAEIGSMRISDEIDALFTMGLNPTVFLAVPRMVAAVFVVPLLTLFSDVFAIAGGLVVGVLMLNLSPSTYLSQTFDTITLFDVSWGFLKSAVFAALIAWTGCLRGFQVRGGASEVGAAATSAVVSSIFLIILFDSVFAVIRSYWN
jgi:phospholipid/cholesterol/gamma-HCH transport system permease protein